MRGVFMRGKSKKMLLFITIIGVIIYISAITAVIFYNAKPVTQKSGFSIMIDAFPYEEGKAYYPYDYGYQKTVERLFSERCEHIFYGEIVESELFSTNTRVDSESSNVYAYALLKVKVLKSIYGDLDKKLETYLVMPYSGQTEEEEEIVQKGTEGLFIPRTPTVEVTFDGSGRKVEAIGMVGEIDHRFCCEEKLLPELKQLNSLEDVKEFWKENNLCQFGGPNY